MKKKALLFDLDGTLINTVKDLNVAVNYALEKFHYPPRSLEQTRRDIGNGVAMLIARSIPDGKENKDYEGCLKTFRNYYRDHYSIYSEPYPNIKEVLLHFKKQGYFLAVVTNKFEEGAKKLIDFHFPNIFDLVIGESTKNKCKPDPFMVKTTLKVARISKKEALYIGDTEVDFLTASNAKIDCLLVSYGYRSKEELKEKIKSEITIATSPLEIKEILG